MQVRLQRGVNDGLSPGQKSYRITDPAVRVALSSSIAPVTGLGALLSRSCPDDCQLLRGEWRKHDVGRYTDEYTPNRAVVCPRPPRLASDHAPYLRDTLFPEPLDGLTRLGSCPAGFSFAGAVHWSAVADNCTPQ